jgi:hypothetical protein
MPPLFACHQIWFVGFCRGLWRRSSDPGGLPTGGENMAVAGAPAWSLLYFGPPPGLAPSRYAPGPRPDPDMNQGPAHGTGPVWGQSCPQMSTGSQQSRSSQLKHRIRYPLHGSGRSGPETGLRSGVARARGMDRDGRGAGTHSVFSAHGCLKSPVCSCASITLPASSYTRSSEILL